MTFPRRLLVAILLSALVLPSAGARAGKKKKGKEDTSKGSCTSAAQVGSDVWKYAGPILTEVLDKASPQTATVSQILKAIDKGIRAWNKLAGNSWAKIGPRRLDMNKTLGGNLIGVTERVFVAPMVSFRSVTVDFYKLGGKGKIKVVVCKVAKGRRPEMVTSFFVDEKTKSGKVKTVGIKDAAGKLIKVVLHGKKFGTTAIKYQLKANESRR